MTAAACVLAGCISVPDFVGNEASDAGLDARSDAAEGTAFRRDIVVAPVLAGSLGVVPIAVKLENDSGFRDHALADGSDLLVVDEQGRVLDTEIESIDTVAGDLTLWVRLEQLRNSGEILSLYYGETHSADVDKNRVFSDAALVWHFTDEPGRTVVDSAGSTVADRDNGTTSSPIEPAAGVCGSALKLDADDNVETSSDRDIYPGTEPWTLSFWLTAGETLGRVLRLGSGGVGEFGFDIEVQSGLDVVLRRFNQGPINNQLVDSAGTDGVAHFITVRIARDNGITTVELFFDGSQVESFRVDNTTNFDGMDPLDVGGVGLEVDELRIYQRALSDDEIQLAYQNTNNPTFATVGVELPSDYPSL